MFPNIEAKNGGQPLGERVVLIGCGNNGQAITLFDKPRPTRSKSCCRGFCEFLFEGIKRPESCIDRFSQISTGSATSVGPHHFPEQVVIICSATMVTNHSAHRLRHCAQVT